MAKSKQQRVNLRVSPSVYAYLGDLVELGIHGETPTDVARVLLINQLERLIKDGFLKMRTAVSGQPVQPE